MSGAGLDTAPLHASASPIMGRLRDLLSGRCYALEGNTIIGRSPHCGLRLTDDRVSNEHASVRWRGGRWVLRDLGSTNHSWVNKQLVPPGVDVELSLEDTLSFGVRELAWLLDGDGAPQPMVFQPSGGDPCVIEAGVIAIPSAENMAASIFCGADGSWILECGDRVRPITSGDLIEVLGQVWRFSCPTEWQATNKVQQFRMLRDSVLHFDVSSDEEAVTLTVLHGQERIPIGQLVGNYLLLTLARRRDEERKIHPASEAGWIHREELTSMLKCPETQLNVWVHRIRERFSSKGFLDHAAIIERRDRTGQLRIGVEQSIIAPTT